jgi:hypothetical protein
MTKFVTRLTLRIETLREIEFSAPVAALMTEMEEVALALNNTVFVTNDGGPITGVISQPLTV